MQYGIKNIDCDRKVIEKVEYARVSQKLEKIDYIFEEENKDLLSKEESQFLDDCRRATTDAAVRIRRSEFIAKLILG